MDTKSALQKEYVDRKSFDVEEIEINSLEKVLKKSEFDEKWNNMISNMTTLLSPMKIL